MVPGEFGNVKDTYGKGESCVGNRAVGQSRDKELHAGCGL